MPSLNEFLFGGGDKFRKRPNYTPGQMQNFDQLNNMTSQSGQGANDVLSYLMQFLDPNSDVFKNFEAPYRQEFEEETVPNLAEHYAGKGALSSSGFGQALGSAGAGLQTKLAALKSGMQRQAGQDILGQYNQNVQNSLNAQPYYTEKQSGSSGLLNNFLSGGAANLTGGGGLFSMLSDLLKKKIGGNVGTAGVR